MAKIYFICGFIGSGKTTYSTQLAESTSAFRFSMDEWMIPLYGEHMQRDVFDARLAVLQGLFKDAALQMLNLGVSVIFDFGFWSKKDRDEFNDWASQQSIQSEMHYLDVSVEVCRERATLRNAKLEGKSYEMTPDMLDLFWSWFEVPSDENVVIVNTGV